MFSWRRNKSKSAGKVAYTEAQVKEILRQCDKNGDGVLSRAEVEEAFKHLGSNFPLVRALVGIIHADCDGDGVISQYELDRLAKFACAIGYTTKV